MHPQVPVQNCNRQADLWEHTSQSCKFAVTTRTHLVMCALSVPSFRVWVCVHPRRTARIVPSLGVWVCVHPRRTARIVPSLGVWVCVHPRGMLFDYLFIMGRICVIFGQHTVCPFINKVIKFQHDCLNSN